MPNYEDDKDLVWEEIETEHIVQDEWINFRKSAYRYPDGRVFAPYYSYSRRDYTVIVASDEEGNYIYNKWGDRAVRHYYSDKNGNFYLDDNGEKILIPIDSYGQDQKDPDFLNHYFEGWYKKGYLEEPTEEETEEGEESADGEETAADETENSGEETAEPETGEPGADQETAVG